MTQSLQAGALIPVPPPSSVTGLSTVILDEQDCGNALPLPTSGGADFVLSRAASGNLVRAE